MKTLLLVCMALVCAATSHAQEIRLDSLWAKFGGVAAMTFSPDSKQLLISERMLEGDKGNIIIYDAMNGATLDSITKTDFIDFHFTRDGNTLIVSERNVVKFYNAATYALERTIPNDSGGYIALSPDPSIIALYGDDIINIFNVETGQKVAHITRPYRYFTTPNKEEWYYNGKVCFNEDGRYIIGKYKETVVRWDWKNAPDKPEVIISSFPNQPIIGFSPDRTLLVQRSNFLWSIVEKRQVPIEGIVDYTSQNAYGFAVTTGGSCIAVINQSDHTPKFISTSANRPFSATPLRYALLMAISPDSNFFAYQYGNGQTHLYRVQWNTTGVAVIKDDNPVSVLLYPSPGSKNTIIRIDCATTVRKCDITVINTIGLPITKVYNGQLSIGSQTFELQTNDMPSGNYVLRVQYDDTEISQSFVITK